MMQAYFDFLDELRETGAINMFESEPYLQEAFPELTLQNARNIVKSWMKQFSCSAPTQG